MKNESPPTGRLQKSNTTSLKDQVVAERKNTHERKGSASGGHERKDSVGERKTTRFGKAPALIGLFIDRLGRDRTND